MLISAEARLDSVPVEEAATELGFSFSVAGLVLPYHLGVVEELKAAGLLVPGTPLAGSSGGALAAAFTALELPPEVALEAVDRVCDAVRCSGKSSRGQLGRLLRAELARVLPEDAHTRLNSWKGGCTIGVTLLRPLPTPVYIESFESRQDLIEVLACSCHIPWWCSHWPLTRCRRTLGADGFFSSTATFGCPPTRAASTVCVSPFLASRVFPRPVGPDPSRPNTPLSQTETRGYGAGIISPEVLKEEGRGRPQDLLPVALEPPRDNAFFREVVAPPNPATPARCVCAGFVLPSSSSSSLSLSLSHTHTHTHTHAHTHAHLDPHHRNPVPSHFVAQR
jgi:hypothetical protein